ncbi:DUF433 domain-containing protein [Nostoc sp. UHCC 0926]|uniref:DUF433 domain-containing protein n=2 Tax=unclassified Nostoc TaxID=2593658 RepID=UPI00235E121F|nr:DUF433 domain-containing protein [Nostoc sp. UHCC 0926]
MGAKFSKQAMQTITDIGTLIVSTPGTCGGRPRIAGHRITIHNIAIDFNAGMKPEEIVAQRPQLMLAQVYAALAYYYVNKEVIDTEIAIEIEEYDRLEAEYTPKRQ